MNVCLIRDYLDYPYYLCFIIVVIIIIVVVVVVYCCLLLFIVVVCVGVAVYSPAITSWLRYGGCGLSLLLGYLVHVCDWPQSS